MTPEEYEVLCAPQPKIVPTISALDLKYKNPRTLLWGYNHRSESHHVYIEDGKIHLHVYMLSALREAMLGGSAFKAAQHQSGVIAIKDLLPDKRLYPEACDAEFCMLLKDRGVYLPFTKWQDREIKQFYGEKVEIKNDL